MIEDGTNVNYCVWNSSLFIRTLCCCNVVTAYSYWYEVTKKILQTKPRKCYPFIAAGDSGSTRHDAEIHSYNDYMKVFRSDVGGSSCLTSKRNTIKTAMTIQLSKNQMYATNYAGFNYYTQDRGLFAFDTMYMGLNRVVSSLYGSRSRTGRGLCRVCIYFLKESVRDLHQPYAIGSGGTGHGSISTGPMRRP